MVYVFTDWNYIAGAMHLLVKVKMKVAKVGLVSTFYSRLLFYLIGAQKRQLVLRGLRYRKSSEVWVLQGLNHHLHRFKLLIKFGIISGLFFAKISNCLLRNWIHVSKQKFEVWKKFFKLWNSLLKQGNKDFPKIAIVAKEKFLRGSCFCAWKCTKSKINRVLDYKEVI